MTQRKPLIAGNWKMHKSVEESVDFAKALHAEVGTDDAVDVIVAPTTVAVHAVAQALQNSMIRVAGQNVHPQPQGAFTGEVSPAMLQAAGCQACIVGHSERRQFFGDTDEFVRDKVLALLEAGITPIFCLGESLEEREQGKTFEKVGAQLKAVYTHLNLEQSAHMIVAYEPIWAIGTGKTATPEQAQEVHVFLREQLAALTSPQQAAVTRILYGGSVKPANVDDLMAQSDIDGALVGGASLKVDSFTALVRSQQ